MNRFSKLNLKKIKKYPIKDRKNLVSVKDFACLKRGKSVSSLIESMPDILGGKDLKYLIDGVLRAKKYNKTVVLAMGAHVIKCGLSPLVIELMKNGVIKAIAMNGAGAIHDYEIALIGGTSEDVESQIEEGFFGMALETGKALNKAVKNGASKGTGFGKALGEIIKKESLPYKDLSIVYNALILGIPVTIHVAVGTDTIHMDPDADGEAIGKASLLDFRAICSVVSTLDGGIWINMGSAVILPEVFLKAVTVCRNIGIKLENFLTVNIDMISHYRPLTNVVRRPTLKGGKGINLIGQYEILFPLLAAAILERLKGEG
ncbi:MAG: hypothetical protein A3C43_10410 [Candidatus Schekmanbacteria bacterium RIFCSPHIGHO2_02_FULL_38_11]|uniref:Deoxyhypusine synthase n=1 Tax=Candidatus Schekmanbacteria bacterium RIFCSPLOWO2_12_FULL_38_15 TaxID=1817883 RepID=A0A1F7SJ09_9BACT|nr:MAG: hypothetical protein A2043_07210 [Candidatus Schekmanbacteria bacterium GWA2_38_9]OGL49290.1 MAG: hypothetical protein A3H37_04785 [Candidatus Schekmanbacteria bacterium RIFCSPLOWO2_02_FULL_38_14]OGL53755.1 MAG: hypothetical protein A3G31_03140 [Candidatus Schekmanbacteria bacterium RIFCSPLOWO2_12_FULL_38_15]OGL54748.1 MAG: hypothetical protein A3C43_10410 [Candidatus Schekmanbacteria bacterium RIFCSPHIGHO2_02_FULL_38_11]